MSQKFNFQSQLEHLHSRYPGSGHSDLTRWEFATNVQRDTLASHISHYNRMLYLSAIQGQCQKRLRIRMLQQMVRPCGPAPKQKPEKRQWPG